MIGGLFFSQEVIRRKLINKFKNTRRRHQHETAPQLLKDEKRRRVNDAKESGLPMYSPSTLERSVDRRRGESCRPAPLREM